MGAVFAVGGEFGVAEDAEGFAGVIVAHDGFGVEDVFEVATAEAIESGEVGVEFGTELGSVRVFEDDGRNCGWIKVGCGKDFDVGAGWQILVLGNYELAEVHASVVPESTSPFDDIGSGIGQGEYTRYDIVNSRFSVRGWRKNRKLLQIPISQMCSTNFSFRYIITYKGINI